MDNKTKIKTKIFGPLNESNKSSNGGGYVSYNNLLYQDKVIGPDGKEYDMAKLRKNLNTIRFAFVKNKELYGAIIYIYDSLVKVATFDVPTMGVDGIRLFMNPAFSLSLKPSELAAVLIHECFHILYLHLERAETNGFEPGRANVAGDYEINLAIETMDPDFKGIFTRLGCLYDEKYKDMYFEQIYRELPNTRQKNDVPDHAFPEEWSEGYRDAWNEAVKELRDRGLIK